MGQKRDERAGSCGFSPFPVFGPFAVSPVPNSTKMAPKAAMDTQWDEVGTFYLILILEFLVENSSSKGGIA
jgi:hypothetical protein